MLLTALCAAERVSQEAASELGTRAGGRGLRVAMAVRSMPAVEMKMERKFQVKEFFHS